MTRYLMYKLGLAVLFYAVYYMRPMMVFGLKTSDTRRNNTHISNEDYFVYYQGADGTPGVDFPILSHIPKTTFSCQGLDSGYYADMEADCQVFHICEEKKKISFLCPNGTIFDQSELICEWWFKVNCTLAADLYEESAEYLREQREKRKNVQKLIDAGHVFNNHGAIMRTEERTTISAVQNGKKIPIYQPNVVENTNNNVYQTGEKNKQQTQQSTTAKPHDLTNDININFKPEAQLRKQPPSLVEEFQPSELSNNNSSTQYKTGRNRVRGGSLQSSQRNSQPVSRASKNANLANKSSLIFSEINQEIHNSNPVKKETGNGRIELASASQSSTKHFDLNDAKTTRIPLQNKTSTFTTLVVNTLSGQRLSDVDRYNIETSVAHTTSQVHNTQQQINQYSKTSENYSRPSSNNNRNSAKSSKNVQDSFTPTSNTSKKGSPNHRQKLQSHTIPNRRMSENANSESQIVQETGSFLGRTTANYTTVTKLYPNHRSTYSELMPKPKLFSTKVLTLSSVTPQYITTQPINNGKPFLGSQVGAVFQTTVKPPLMYNMETHFSVRSKTSKSKSRVPITRKQISTEHFSVDKTPIRSTSTPKVNARSSETFNVGKINEKLISRSSTSRPTYSTTKLPIPLQDKFNSGQKENINYVKSTSRPLDHATVYGRFINRNNVSSKPPIQSQSKSKDFKGVTSNVPKLNQFPSPTPPRPFKKFSQKVTTVSPPLNAQKVGFYITKGGSSPFNLGSTSSPTVRSLNVESASIRPSFDSNIVPVKIMKPRPFQVMQRSSSNARNNVNLLNSSPIPITTVPYYTYQLSSAGPFSTTPNPPTEATPVEKLKLSSSSSFVPNHMFNAMVAMAKVNEDYSGETPRPGLVVPPSVGPQTLHTLAVYFANALDGYVENEITHTTKKPKKEKDRLTELLTRMTMNGYKELFSPEEKSVKIVASNSANSSEEDSDLEGQHSKNFDDTNRIRQLARLFTQALSSYLDDPDTFKRILQEVRPTEPSLEGETTTEWDNNDDELLNFSDTDGKSSFPPIFPTIPAIQPTWGYLIPYNSSDSKVSDTDFKNSVNSDATENLQGADTKSFVENFNTVLDEEQTTTDISTTVTESTTDRFNSRLPSDHWTTSNDATKLWNTAFSFDPVHINDNFKTTDFPITTTNAYTTQTDYDDEFNDIFSTTELPDTTRIPLNLAYNLKAISKMNLNQSQVHGMLLNLMSNSKDDHNSRLQRILRKLNTTEEEFLEKMKEIEANPLTRRLILLLISECGTNATREFHTQAVPLHNLLQSNDKKPEELLKTSSSSGVVPNRQGERSINVNDNNMEASDALNTAIRENSEDERALQLLNSLYTIASRFGK